MPHIPASHPQARGLGTVPGALAPSHELGDELRTSARDWVSAPSPLRRNLSRHPPNSRNPSPLRPAPAEVQSPSSATYLLGAAGGSRPPGPSVRAGPQRPEAARCRRAGKDSLWASGPPPGRTSSAGRKTPEPRRRSREAGGGPPWPGRAAGGGGCRGYAAPSPAEDRTPRPRRRGPAPLGAPAPRPRGRPPGGSPRLTAGRSVRAASARGRLAAESADSASRSSRAGRDAGKTEGGRGRGERGAQTIQGAARRGGGERRGGGRGGKLPQEGALLRPPSRGLRLGPPAPAPTPRPGHLPSRRAPPPPSPRPGTDHPLPKHRPLMSFPDLPSFPARPAGAGDLTHRPYSGLSRRRSGGCPRGAQAARRCLRPGPAPSSPGLPLPATSSCSSAFPPSRQPCAPNPLRLSPDWQDWDGTGLLGGRGEAFSLPSSTPHPRPQALCDLGRGGRGRVSAHLSDPLGDPNFTSRAATSGF